MVLIHRGHLLEIIRTRCISIWFLFGSLFMIFKFVSIAGIMITVAECFNLYDNGVQGFLLVPHSLSLWPLRNVDSCFHRRFDCLEIFFHEGEILSCLYKCKQWSGRHDPNPHVFYCNADKIDWSQGKRGYRIVIKLNLGRNKKTYPKLNILQCEEI